MLSRLIIKDFAIIEDIDITFYDGLTVLTGETGAGKSLLIDSISLLLGDRASLEMIRNGKKKAVVTGYFDFNNPYIAALLEKNNINSNSNQLIITRIIEEKGSSIKINGTSLSLIEERKIAHFLADIHQQFDMTKLYDKENYLSIIDGFKRDTIEEYKNKYLLSLANLKEINNTYLNLVKEYEELKKRKEEYEYFVSEIEKYNLKINEEDEIENRISLLENYDYIYSLLEETKQLINKDSLDDIYNIKENLLKIGKYQNEYLAYKESLEEYYFQIEEIYSLIKNKLAHLDYNKDELDELLNRQSEIKNLKRKYNKTVEELLIEYDDIKKRIDNEDNYDYLINKAKKDVLKAYEDTLVKALDLSKIRKNASKIIEKEIVKTLDDLSLKVRFEIKFYNKEIDINSLDLNVFSDEGIDDIDFFIETNVGEGLKTLSKIVSGGEASRISLAMKILYVKSQNIKTIIFDEIDTGVSGEISARIGQKLYELGLSRQVIVITHLPQVASLANTHLKIQKEIRNDRTYTIVKELSYDERIKEIASLLSSGNISTKQIEYAKEMLSNKRK